MTRNKNLCFMVVCRTCEKIKLAHTVVSGMCEKIRKPINTMISGKVLTASQFASANLYCSGQAPEKLKKHIKPS